MTTFNKILKQFKKDNYDDLMQERNKSKLPDMPEMIITNISKDN